MATGKKASNSTLILEQRGGEGNIFPYSCVLGGDMTNLLYPASHPCAVETPQETSVCNLRAEKNGCTLAESWGLPPRARTRGTRLSRCSLRASSQGRWRSCHEPAERPRQTSAGRWVAAGAVSPRLVKSCTVCLSGVDSESTSFGDTRKKKLRWYEDRMTAA